MKQWLAENYGSRRGAVKTYWHSALYLLGGYRGYKKIDWKSAQRLVFVCKGNICRSAFAEAVARSLGVECVSCGIDTSSGSPANETAVRIAASKGFDLSGHRTTPIQSLTLCKNDLLIAMEPWQVDHLRRELGSAYEYTLLGLWGEDAKPYIHDPYGGHGAYFDNCFQYIEKSVHEIARKISEAKRS